MSSFDCFIYSRLVDTNSQCRVTNRDYASYLKQAKKTGKTSIIQRLKDGRGKHLYYRIIGMTELSFMWSWLSKTLPDPIRKKKLRSRTFPFHLKIVVCCEIKLLMLEIKIQNRRMIVEKISEYPTVWRLTIWRTIFKSCFGAKWWEGGKSTGKTWPHKWFVSFSISLPIGI